MGEAVFDIRDAERPDCDYPGCSRVQRYVVSLVGSVVFPRHVCRYHKRWARADLVAREVRRAASSSQEGEG